MDADTSEPSEHGTAPGQHLPGEQPIAGHSYRHGRPTSWVFVAVLVAAFIAGAFALVTHFWPVFWVCLGITVLSVPAGKIVGIMGDTVLAGDPEGQAGQGGHVAEDYGSAVYPGVEVGPTPAITSNQPAEP